MHKPVINLGVPDPAVVSAPMMEHIVNPRCFPSRFPRLKRSGSGVVVVARTRLHLRRGAGWLRRARRASARAGPAARLWRARSYLGSRPAIARIGRTRSTSRATAANPAGLTRREMEVLAYLAAGLSNSALAARLTLSSRTIDNHVSAILRKLRVQTRDQARAQTSWLGISPTEPDTGADS